MINLLPQDIKNQLIFARHNALLRKYFNLTLVVLALAGATLAGGNWYLNMQAARADADLAAKQAEIETYQDLENQAKIIAERLKSIKQAQSTQAHFSALLQDLAAVTPRGVFINEIALTGDEKKPVRIVATANSYNDGVALREGLARSARIAAADIESITAAPGSFAVAITIAFKPGQAK